MAEMVGGTSFIGAFRTADIAALVIILVEVSMGLFLMESLRITRLFPVIGALPDKIRVRMIWITFAILTLLATVEAGLAYMREVLLQDELATSALLRGEQRRSASRTTYLWITTAAQMGMGFIAAVCARRSSRFRSRRSSIRCAPWSAWRHRRCCASSRLVLRAARQRRSATLGTRRAAPLRPADVRAAVDGERSRAKSGSVPTQAKRERQEADRRSCR